MIKKPVIMKRDLSYIGILTVLLFFVSACKSDRQGDRAPALMDDEETAASVSMIEQIKHVYYLCPSPAEMLSVIDLEGLSYDGSFLNPIENAEQYLDMKSRTVNLGIYITDLAYSALFGRHTETLNYLETVRYMAEEIKLAGAINDQLLKDARNNVEYVDSLFNISNQAFVDMLLYCERNQRPGTIILISAGTFIESMYIAINLVEDYDHAGQIISHLAEQKLVLDNLMMSAREFQDENATVAEVIDALEPIQAIYNRLEIQEGSTTVTKDVSNKLVIGGGSGPLMSPEEFESLKAATFSLRDEITGNE